MKKIGIIVLFLLCLTSCDNKKEESAELVLNQSGEPIVLSVSPTEDPEEVSHTLNTIKDYGTFDFSTYNGVQFDLSSKIVGDVDIHKNEKVSSIHLDYELTSNVMTNLKRYQLNGTIQFKGSSSTQSESFSIKSNSQCSAQFQNDDENLYLDASLATNDNRLSWKLKTDISTFTAQYKGTIIGILDLLQYYPISTIIEDVDALVREYQVRIAAATKDTITFGFYIPTEQLESKLYLEVCISCQSLLPVRLEVVADDIIKEILQKKYIEEYLSENVIVKNATYSFGMDIQFGKYQIASSSEEEKEKYLQVDYQTILDYIKNLR